MARKASRNAELKKHREILLLRRDAIVQTLEGDDSLLKELSHQSGGDAADVAAESTNGEISSQLIEVSQRELENIDAALLKLKEGSYGVCTGCSGNIAIERLEALPYAVNCIGCQRAAEKAGVEPGKVVDWSLILDQNISAPDFSFKIR